MPIVLGLKGWRRQLRRRDLDNLPHASDHDRHRGYDSPSTCPSARGNQILPRFVMSGLPDELTVYAAALSTPDGHPVIGFIPAWCGDDLVEGERVLEPLRKFGSPIADLISRMPYAGMQQMSTLQLPLVSVVIGRAALSAIYRMQRSTRSFSSL